MLEIQYKYGQCYFTLIDLTWNPALLLPPATNDPPEKESDAEQAGRHQQLWQYHHDLLHH